MKFSRGSAAAPDSSCRRWHAGNVSNVVAGTICGELSRERRDGMMERKMVLVLIMVVAVGVWCLASGVSPAQVKSPADFSFEQGKASPGKVTFSHQKDFNA